MANVPVGTGETEVSPTPPMLVRESYRQSELVVVTLWGWLPWVSMRLFLWQLSLFSWPLHFSTDYQLAMSMAVYGAVPWIAYQRLRDCRPYSGRELRVVSSCVVAGILLFEWMMRAIV